MAINVLEGATVGPNDDPFLSHLDGEDARLGAKLSIADKMDEQTQRLRDEVSRERSEIQIARARRLQWLMTKQDHQE